MAKKKHSRNPASLSEKRAAKKAVLRSRKQSSGRRRVVAVSGQAAAGRLPKEWQSGRIVLGKLPAKPLKGRNSERVPTADLRDADGLPIPRKVCDWFVRKLDPSHKVSVRADDS